MNRRLLILGVGILAACVVPAILNIGGTPSSEVVAGFASEDVYVFLPFLQTEPRRNGMFQYTGSASYGAKAERDDLGKVLFIGHTGDGGFAMKLDARGEAQWINSYSSSSYHYFQDGFLVDDGGAVVVGATQVGMGNYDVMVIGLDGLGNVRWSKTIGGSAAEGDYPFNAFPATGGGFYVVTESRSFSSNNDAWVMKFDTDGNIIWQKLIGGVGSEIARSAAPTLDGGLVFAGFTNGSDTAKGGYFVKLDSAGNDVWQKVIHHPCTVGVMGDLHTLKDGRLVGTGFGANGACVMVFSATADFLWGREFSGGGGQYDRFYDAMAANDGSIIVAGGYDVESGDDYGRWVVKFSGTGDILWQKTYDTPPSGYALKSVLAIDEYSIWFAGDNSTIIRTSLGGDVDDCPLVSNSFRTASPITVTSELIDLPISNGPATASSMVIDATPLSATRETICPTESGLLDCPTN